MNVTKNMKDRPDYYRTLLSCTVPESVEDQILKDLHRTFPEHPDFELGTVKMEKMRRILTV